MRCLLLLFCCYAITVNAEQWIDSEQYLVLDVSGPARISRAFDNDSWRVKKGNLLTGSWRLVGEQASQLSLLCGDNAVATIVRNQLVQEACKPTIQHRGDSLIRYRTDTRDENLPHLLRPLSTQVLDLFPIRWQYKQRARVDIYLTNIGNGKKIKIASGLNGQELTQAPDDLQSGQYKVSICRAGSQRLCNINSDNAVGIHWLDDAARENVIGTISRLQSRLSTPYSIDGNYLRAVYLFSQNFPDDALATISSSSSNNTNVNTLRHLIQLSLGIADRNHLLDNLSTAMRNKDDINAVSICQALMVLSSQHNDGEAFNASLKQQYPQHCVSQNGKEQ